MPLTALILDGFKSFADKTTLHFGNGITGIVGPNGSGKSNITEAIRWVMGESSAKSLRGNKMKDVIFAGSEFLAPLNRASVTLVFDNRNGELKSKAAQVTITRHILRSGDGEYLINGQTVRLKDVRALFLDAGISQQSLAIISQGRVDQILNSRPEQRRSIFEEAAGVLHFKQQKALAATQLKQTQNNLIRINDLVKGLKQRVEPLHEQSSLAKEYRFQKKGLDDKLKVLLAFQIQILNRQKKQIQKKGRKSEKILAKLDQQVQSSKSTLSKLQASNLKLQKKRTRIENRLGQLNQKLADLNTKLQIAVQSKHFNRATVSEYQQEAHSFARQVKDLQTVLKTSESKEKQIKQQQSRLFSRERALKKQEVEGPEALSKKIEQARNAYIDQLQAQTSANNRLAYLRTELKKVQTQRPKADTHLTNQLADVKRQVKELEQKGQKLRQKEKDEQANLNKLKTKVAQAKQARFKLEQEVRKQHDRWQQARARQQALLNIQKRHEGYYYGVRNILNHSQAYPGVIGVVGELLSFPATLEAAMTTALGGSVQDLITVDQTQAKRAIQTLKRREEGRATFLPLDGLHQFLPPRSILSALKAFSGFKGVASSLVTSRSGENITPAINYLLGSVLVVDTIEMALRVRQLVGRYRIVTLDGDIIAAGGSMTGGARNRRGHSPLQLTTEITALTQQNKEANKQIQKSEQKLQQERKREENLSEALAKNQKIYQTLQHQLNQAALNYQTQDQERKRLMQAQDLLLAQSSARDKELASLKEKIAMTQLHQRKLKGQGQIQAKALTDLQERRKRFQSQREQLHQKLAALAPQIAVVKNKLENMIKIRADQRHQLSNCRQQLANLQQKMTELQTDSQSSETQKDSLKVQQAEFQKERDNFEDQDKELTGRLVRMTAKINQLTEVTSRNYDLRKAAAAERQSYSVQVTKLNGQLDQKLARLSNDYALTYEAALGQAKIENNTENRAALKKSVKLHRLSLADIGEVNLKAIDDYAAVKKRYDFLSKQQADLLKARGNLQKSMSKLDQTVAKRFATSFKKISASFKQLFPLVFGGGSAKLMLTAPDQLLTTGIEIVAQPPGKKLQRLSLLSGGERALTAITLLFAMLRVNPVPFCILDEVEAALDETNVVRFAHFLRRFDLQTQFIVITHRRGTMERADRLLGVVMQESGVSQVLSVSLKKIKNEVHQSGSV